MTPKVRNCFEAAVGLGPEDTARFVAQFEQYKAAGASPEDAGRSAAADLLADIAAEAKEIGELIGGMVEDGAKAGTLTEAQARQRFNWQDMGTKDGTKTHALFFSDPADDRPMRYGEVSLFSGSTRFQVDGGESAATLKLAKAEAERVAIARLERDGYVGKTPQATAETVPAEPVSQDESEGPTPNDTEPASTPLGDALRQAKTISGAVKWIAENGQDPALRAIAARILPQVGNAEIVMVTPGKEVPGGVPTSLNISKAVFYENFNTGRKAVFVKDEGFSENGVSEETIIHEALHAATNELIREGNKRTNADTPLGKAVADLFSLQHKIVAELNARHKAGTQSDFEKQLHIAMATSDAREVLAWGMTNAEFQSMLKGIKVDGKPAWSQFVAAIRKVLGLGAEYNDALSELLTTADRLLSAGSLDAKVVSAPEAPAPGMGRLEVVSVYNTAGGKEAMRIKRLTGSDGAVTYSWIGEYGAGSGHSFERMRDIVATEKRAHRGMVLASGAEFDSLQPAPPSGPIEDVGEKIGGARKDTAISGGTRSKRASEDDRPAWARRFEISQIVTPGGQINEVRDAGRWVIRDTRSLDRMKQPKQVGRDTYATKEEAEAVIPLAAVSLKHRPVPVADGKYEIWRDITDRKRVKVLDRQFDTREEAMAYMAANAQSLIETNTTFGEADIPVPPDRKRTGPQRRTENATGEGFKDTFGFRAVEFGNWNNQDERQDLMNDAWDGLMDLADVLGVPPKALGLNGDLALAFGARGHGLNSARAHYELDRAVINLTKENGAGSLAHEWFHALDHYFGRQDGKASSAWVVQADGTRTLKVGGPEDGMASHGFQRGERSGVRPEVRAAYDSVLTTMFKKAEAYVEDTAKVDKFTGRAKEELAQALDGLRSELAAQKDPTYYKRNNKPASAELLAEVDALSKAMLEGEATALATEWKSIQTNKAKIAHRWTNDSLERLGAIYKEVRGRSGFDSTNRDGRMDRLRGNMERYSQRLKMLAEAQAGTEKTKMVPTEFAMNARELDQGRGTDYWTTPHEMAARAFQGYVEDKVAEAGGMSRFLNYGPANVVIITPWGFKRPFPAGEERTAINKAFDAFISELQTKETDKGIAVYEPQAAYSAREQYPYETDLFGNPLPAPAGKPRAGRAAAGRTENRPVGGDVLGDTAAPAGEYLTRTIVGIATQRTVGASVIKTAADAASATAYLGESAVERFDGLLTDKDGKPLALIGGFKGALAQTSVYPATLVGEAMRVPGAANLWLSHNHPSGKSELSQADKYLNNTITDVFNGTGIEVRGTLAIGDGRFSAVDQAGAPTAHEASIPASKGSATVPAIERQIAVRGNEPALTSPAAAKDAAKAAYSKFGGPGILLMSSQHDVLGWVPVAGVMSGRLRGTGGLAAIYRAVSEANVGAAILVHGGELDALVGERQKAANNIASALAKIDVRTLDIINVKTMASAAERGETMSNGILLSQAPAQPLTKLAASTTGTDPGKLTAMVANIRAGWADAPPVEVVATTNDLPANLVAELRRARAFGTARALIIPNTGKVYLIADRLESLADAQFVLFHEVLGHYGLRKFLGADYEKTMRQMRAMNAGLAAESRSWMAAYGTGQIEARVARGMSYADATVEVDLLSVEEALADRAGKPEQISGFKRLVAKLQAWLREHGFMEVAKWLEGKTQAQVLSLLQSARDAVEKAEGVHAYTEPAAALLSQADQTDTPAFKRWFGKSRVVDAEGKPLVVYHGTDSVFTEFSRTGDIGHHFGTEIAARDRAARVGGAEVLVEPVTLSQVEKDSLSSLNGEIGGTPAADLYALLLRKLDSPRQNLRAQVEAMPADEIKKVKAEYLEQPDSLRFAERVDRAKAGEGFRVEVNGETVSTHRTVREANARAARLRERAATPMALYLRIENPIRLPDLGVWPAQEIAKEAGFSKREMERVVEAGTAEQQYEAVRAILESKGFDGIVYRNEVEHAGEDSYIAFRPEQIKSATGNSGAFDPSNPSILLSQIQQGKIPGTSDTEQEAITKGYKARVNRALKRADGVINGLGELPDTEQYLGQRYLALGKIAAVDKIAGDIRAAFRKASPADKRAIYAYLTTAGANTDGIADPETKTMAAKVKRYIGTVGDQLVARGLISEESREAYRDAYLPRLYLAHLLSDGDWRAIGAGKKVSDMGYLKARKDIPQEIRDVILGEVKDPAFLAATAIAKPMRDMALLDWLAQISENQQWVLANSMTEWNGKRVSVFWLKAEADALRTRARHYPEEANRTAANAVAERMDAAAVEAMDGADFNHKDYKQIPNQPKYGRLRGIYVRAEIYNDLMGAQEFLPSDPGWAMHLLGYGGLGTKATQLWKMSKVALNIPGQVRNAISNGVMLQLSGVPLHKLPILMGRAISQIRHGGRHWLVAKKYGVTESTFQAQEMFRARRDLLDLERDLKGLTPLVALKTVGAVIADAAGDAYQFTEALFKTVKIMDAMEREGMDEEAAAIEAQKWLFDYSLVDKNVRYLRNAPVGMPFLTYTTKVLPRLAEVALLHPQRFLPWVALMYGMQAWAQSMFGGDDDEWDELKKALPKWMQEKGHIAFLPWRDDAGRLQAVDMSYFFPWSQWAEFGRSLTEGDLKGAGKAMGLFGGPVTSVITAWATGEDSFTGRQIINEGDPTSYQAASLLAYTWDLMMPPMMGSSGVVSPMWLLDPQYGGKLAQASTGATNRMGDQKATYGQAASRIIGFNAYGIDPEVTRTSNLIGMKADIAKARAALRSKLGNQGLTPAQQKKLIEDYTTEMAKRAKEMQKYAEESTVPDFARRQKVTE